MKRKFKYLALAVAFVMAFCGFLMIAKNTTNQTVKAADYSYTEGVDGISSDENGNLVVDFTVTYGTDGELHNWVVYFFSEKAKANFAYDDSDHKYYDSASMDRNTAEYYFVTDCTNYSGHVHAVISPDAHAYSNKGLSGEPTSITDYLQYDTGKTLAEVAAEDNWYVSAGPLWSSPWSSTGYAYNVDVYVGRGSELPSFASTVNFRDFDGSIIYSESYTNTNTTVDTDNVNFTQDQGKTFTGWYCDTNKQTYNNLEAIEELTVKNILSSTRTVNFYATYQRGNGQYIEFTPVANYTQNFDTDGNGVNDAILLETTSDDTTFTVTYKITHNDGVNSILLLPEYDTSVFSIKNIVVDSTTALGAPTLTYNGFDKILLESENVYSDLNDAFITITFNIDNPKDGDYEFGLKLVPYVHNDVSEAYYWLEGTKLGEQEELNIVVVKTQNIVRIVTMKDAEIEIGKNDEYYNEYDFTYNGSTRNIERISFDTAFDTDATVIEYKYNGTAAEEDIVKKWYTKSGNVYTEIDAPVLAGEYYVGISAPAHGMYHAVDTVYREVYIYTRNITISLDNKTSAYGEDIVPLTYTIISGSVLQGDNLGISLSTAATSSSDVGNYQITGTYNSNAVSGKYDVYIYSGTYTITPKAITITALDQSAVYTGSEPTVDQTKYTVTGATITEGVIITKEAGVNVGQYTLTPSLNNNNYTVTAVTGKFYITSVNYNESFFTPYFSGDTVTYDAVSHDLLIVQNLPDWFSYTANNNIQTNANEYLINVQVTLTEQNAANYTNGVNEFNFTVPAEIEKYALTVTAADKTSEYGTTPATLTPTHVGLNNEVEVNFTVKDNGTPITLSSTTNVGEYDIVPFASNSNYTFTFVNGTYTVTKTTPVIELWATSVYYNRPLEYTVTVTVAGQQINAYTLSVDGNNLPLETVLNAGDHILAVNVPEGANYVAASDSTGFEVQKVELATPTFTYNHATATWTAVTTDYYGVALVEGTEVAYTINDNATTNCTYTATSTAELIMIISATNNSNYLPAEIDLKEVYSVQFTSIEGSFGAATNMPATQYQFKGQLAVQPDSDPAMTGYTFNGWDFTFTTPINANTQIPAKWNIIQYTMTVVYVHSANNTYVETSKTFNVNYNSNVVINTSNFIEKANITDIVSQYNLNGMRYTFNGFWNYKITGEDEYIRENVTDIVVNATENYTFVALYNATPIVYNITYMVSVDGGEYTAMQNATNVEAAFGSEIELDTLNNIVWFNADAWYTDTDRTQLVPETMPARDLTVYGAYVFDIGTGDINADGNIDANDIMLYRQWIVGGYEMTVLSTDGEILEAANNETTNSTETRYLLVRVADNNGDNSKDIRDISITRMAIVGGYTWDIETGYNVTGQEIIRNVNSSILNNLDAAIRAGKKVTLTDDVTEENGIINISTTNNVEIDLNGHTLTVKSFAINSTSRSTITIKNGTIVTEEGITISAPYGNVVLTDLVGYDKYGLVNLAAANHSLHINGLVKFNKGTDTTVQNPEPAEVKVEKGTHVVIEPEAQLIVEQLVVTTNNFAQEATQAEEVISISNNSAVAVVEVKNNKVVNENTISTYAELVAAVANGGSYTLVADINCGDNDIVVAKDLTLDLNNYTITFTGWGFEVRNNATLTFNGNGNVTAVQAPLYAQYAGHLVINGGTYTATENFVIGTHGSEGRGNNTITINGGVFNGSMSADGRALGYTACGIYVANSDTVVVNAGTFNITNGVGIVARSGNTTIGADVVFNVTGNGELGKVGDSQVTVPAGKELVIDLAANYPGGTPVLVNNTEYDICGVVKTVANINALRNIVDEIVLAADITTNDQAPIQFGKDIVLNLNGHTVRSTNDVALRALNGAKLTINGEGNVYAQEACVMAFDASEIVINGGIFTAYDNFVVGTNGSTGRGLNTITINGGTFNGGIQSTGYVACGIYVANNDTVVVNGGTFNITNGVGILARSGNTTVGANVTFNVTGNGELGKVGDSQVTVPAGQELVLDLKAGYPGGVPTINNNTSNDVYVVVDGTYTFANDDASFHAARGVYDNVILTADLDDYLCVTKDMNLYLNGHTIDVSATSYVAIYVTNGAKLTINGNGNVIATEGCVLVTKGSELVVNGGTYTCYDNFVFGTNGNGGNGGNHITINNGTFNGEIKSAGYIACGIYVANDDTVVVNGGTFNIENGVGILARSGNTTVGANVTFNVTGNGELGKVGDSQVTVPAGEELVLDLKANYPGGQPTLTNNSAYSVYTIENVA